jgi:hypothetical protein
MIGLAMGAVLSLTVWYFLLRKMIQGKESSLRHNTSANMNSVRSSIFLWLSVFSMGLGALVGALIPR